MAERSTNGQGIGTMGCLILVSPDITTLSMSPCLISGSEPSRQLGLPLACIETVPSANRLSMDRYDIEKNSWDIYQHNPNTTDSTPIRRIIYAQSIMIGRLGKAFVISGKAVEGGKMVNGMLIHDFKEQTWEHRGTPWDNWSEGVVNHLTFDNFSSGYILGFAGHGRGVCKPWH